MCVAINLQVSYITNASKLVTILKHSVYDNSQSFYVGQALKNRYRRYTNTCKKKILPNFKVFWGYTCANTDHLKWLFSNITFPIASFVTFWYWMCYQCIVCLKIPYNTCCTLVFSATSRFTVSSDTFVRIIVKYT
jgi:hypothetical protein